MEKLAISVSELAKLLGIGVPHAYDLVHRADFPAIKVGRRTIIPIAKLEEWLAEEAEKGKTSIAPVR
ncbi:Helix-turn-helix domain protein [anaerobic digester metagenome]